MLRLCEGSVRRALSEPSIGSITTRAGPPSPNATSPRSSEIATNEAPASASCLQLGEDGVLAAAVDDKGAVAPLAHSLVGGALRYRGRPLEDLAIGRHDAPADPQPVCAENVHRLHAMSAAVALGHGLDACTGARDPARRRGAAADRRGGDRQDRGPRPPPREPRPRRGRARAGAGPRLVPRRDPTPARRAEALLDPPYEELWIGPGRSSASDCCASTRPRRDSIRSSTFSARPSGWRCCSTASTSCPCASHEIRGNPAGLLAGLLDRIDSLKAGAATPDPELAELVAAHDRILAAAGSLDRGDVFLTLNKLLCERPEVRSEIASRFAHMMVDELEDDHPSSKGDPRLTGRARTRTISTRCEDEGGAIALGAGSSTPRHDVVAGRPVPRPPDPLLALHERAGASASRGAGNRAPAGRGDAAGGDLRAGRRPRGSRAGRSPRRWRSAACPSTSPAPPPSSSGPRCATRSPGCGSWPTPATRPPRRGR